MSKLSHFDDQGQAHMVDISDKENTDRIAVATGRVTMGKVAFDLMQSGNAKKGDVLGTARLAGIMAAKKTSDLIPLCHPIPITKIAIDFAPDESTHSVEISATVKTSGKTGVEMEALTAVNVTALTIYDMLKAVDKTMTITDITLRLKDGGKSGRIENP